MMNNNVPVDIVLTWVNGNDEDWLEQRAFWIKKSGRIEDEKQLDIRFRDWDNIQYVFRGIEKFMPWVRNLYFVTWGHLPAWINSKNSKLIIVNHKDYIPKEFLPTFNSNVIELNFHRIDGLSEKYINFNDDMFIIRETRETDFFVDDLPRDMACISPIYIQNSAITNIQLNNLKIVNKYYSVSDIKRI